jgi:hypothetical protein
MALRMRKGVASAVCALVVLAATCASADAQAGTSVTVYQAFAARGGVTLHTRSRSGHCPTGSEATPRRDAWRCFSGNFVLDPCFSSTHDRGVVVCPEAPWLTHGVEIHLTKPLAAAEGNHAAPSPSLRPWALELSNGLRCLFADGATSVVEGNRLNYLCAGANEEGLWGLPNRMSASWTILIAPFQATKLSERVGIRHAWT